MRAFDGVVRAMSSSWVLLTEVVTVAQRLRIEDSCVVEWEFQHGMGGAHGCVSAQLYTLLSTHFPLVIVVPGLASCPHPLE